METLKSIKKMTNEIGRLNILYDLSPRIVMADYIRLYDTAKENGLLSIFTDEEKECIEKAYKPNLSTTERRIANVQTRLAFSFKTSIDPSIRDYLKTYGNGIHINQDFLDVFTEDQQDKIRKARQIQKLKEK